MLRILGTTVGKTRQLKKLISQAKTVLTVSEYLSSNSFYISVHLIVPTHLPMGV